MTLLLTCATLVTALAMFVAAALVLRSGHPERSRACMASALNELTFDHYRPMARLLSAEDFRFLRSQPGFHPRMEKRLRRQRHDLFCTYLKSMQNDFGAVCDALSMLMLQSKSDRSDLSSKLVRSKAAFGYGLVKVRVQLVFFRFGWAGVDANAVLGVFNSVRLELCAMAPAEMGAAA